MISTSRSVIDGASSRPILLDLTVSDEREPHHLVIFCHGYKGYKDWGAWSVIARAFAENGIPFLKFNFSHNGGTVEDPIDFPDLDAFAENTLSLELKDLGKVIDWVKLRPELASLPLAVIGHSRGGGIAVLRTGQDSRIDGLVTWAGVSDFGSRFPTGSELEKWKEEGVRYVKNARTKQDMPHKYTYYQDFLDNKDELDVRLAAQKIQVPTLVIQGESDEAVPLIEGENLNSWIQDSELRIIAQSGHTFETKHPWKADHLPNQMNQVVKHSIEFITAV